jgi:general secretion pathway protein F
VFLLTYVLPSFEPLFASTGQSLPLPTAIVIAISKAFRHFWWLGVLLITVAIWQTRKSLEKPTTKAKWDAWLLKLPRVGRLITDIELERFKRMLGTLITSGVAVPTALQLAQDVVRNRKIAEAISTAAARLREGGSLARLLALSGFFPAAMLDLIRIGEETGRLDEMLLRQADLDERRIRHEVDRLIALLVPALTILLGFIVAGLIASMLVAILGVNDIALQ